MTPIQQKSHIYFSLYDAQASLARIKKNREKENRKSDGIVLISKTCIKWNEEKIYIYGIKIVLKEFFYALSG